MRLINLKTWVLIQSLKSANVELSSRDWLSTTINPRGHRYFNQYPPSCGKYQVGYCKQSPCPLNFEIHQKKITLHKKQNSCQFTTYLKNKKSIHKYEYLGAGCMRSLNNPFAAPGADRQCPQAIRPPRTSLAPQEAPQKERVPSSCTNNRKWLLLSKMSTWGKNNTSSTRAYDTLRLLICQHETMTHPTKYRE